MSNPSASPPLPKRVSAFPRAEDVPRQWRWFARLLTLYLVSRNRRSTLKTERVRVPALDSAILTGKQEIERSRKYGTVHSERILNVGLYVLLMDRDYAVLKLEMVSTSEDWRLKFTARQIALLLYESCDGLTHLLGKPFRESLTFLALPETEMQEFIQIAKDLNAFKNRNHQFLYVDVRNLISAHREKDSLLFLNAVESLDPMQVFRLGADFYRIIHRLNQFLLKVMERMAQPGMALKQLFASPKFLASLNAS